MRQRTKIPIIGQPLKSSKYWKPRRVIVSKLIFLQSHFRIVLVLTAVFEKKDCLDMRISQFELIALTNVFSLNFFVLICYTYLF